jgi:RNA polymerase sigma factor (sigma-70 family)
MTGHPRPAPEPDAATRDPDLDDVLAAQVDRAAFGVLYRRYLERVYGYCFYLLGDHHDAEDATERTFVAALAAIDGFRDEGSTFRAWLFRIAHNQLANALRSRARRPMEPLDTVPEPSVAIDPLHALTPREREVLAAMAEGRTNVGVAALLGISEGATEKHISNIFGKLDLPDSENDHRRVLAVLTFLGS